MEEIFFGILAIVGFIAFTLLGPIAFFKGRTLARRVDEADLRLKEAETRIALQEARLRDLATGTPRAAVTPADPAPP
ncbi:MAG TPA: hypothetical protein PK812_11495, partial [Beijerinckiaceae bacterium]|nr:hypothetical protein [Beijerinckiaceae bacterium]